MQELDLSEFRYELPEYRIATHPAEPRDQSKLLVYQKGKITSAIFTGLGNFLPEKSLLVFNDTKVIPARLFFTKSTGAVIEVFLLEPVYPKLVSDALGIQKQCTWKILAGNRKKWNTGDILSLKCNNTTTLWVAWEDRENDIVTFTWEPEEFTFSDILSLAGNIPLPPYFKRPPEEIDKSGYQTVYATLPGAVAAPTAGLHFTDNVLSNLSAQGHQNLTLTLHVSGGTFQPLKTGNPELHPMQREQIVVEKEVIESLANNSQPVIPVGTTSLRTLESLYWYGVLLTKDPNANFFIPKLLPYSYKDEELPDVKTAFSAILKSLESSGKTNLEGSTEIFIFPGYAFRVITGLITNFHQPETTLMLLIAALTGKDWKDIYTFALDNEYRFLSYGDSSLLLP
jgi:S-adenosylmethionine:tRNA ribosyltransferase-isomerase